MSQQQFSSDKVKDKWIVGTDGDDALFAGTGNQTLSGGAGDDFLSSVLGGHSVLLGGEGDDRFNFGAKTRFVSGGAGADVYGYVPQPGDHGMTTVEFEKGVDSFDPVGLPDTTRMTTTDDRIDFDDDVRDIHYSLKLVDPADDDWIF